MTVSILIPAAGSSSRMRGRDKLLELVDEEPLLRLVSRRALATSRDVVVTLPPNSERRSVLDGLALKTVVVEDAKQGMSASIRAGMAEINESAKGVMILPADMPDITKDDIINIIQAFDKYGEITRGCTASGDDGHPVVFPKSYFEAFKTLSGDQGAKSLIQDADVVQVPLPEQNALTDLDSPEDWDQWRRIHAANKRAGR